MLDSHLFFKPFYLIALAALIAGEVRAYKSHKRISRVVALPLAYWLIPGIVSIGLPALGLSRLMHATSDFATIGWPLAALVWGAWQILREPSSGVVRSGAAEPMAEGASEESAQLPASRAVPASLKLLRVLLFAGGLFAAAFWLLFVIGMVVADWAGYRVSTAEFGGLFGPLVTFCSYPWVVWRGWRAGRLLIWGAIAHLPLVYWAPRLHEGELVQLLVGALLLGSLTYSVYTWWLWSRDRSPTD